MNETIDALKRSGKCAGKVDIDQASEILAEKQDTPLKAASENGAFACGTCNKSKRGS